ncbi:MAG: glycosyltransferase [Verrucomicrobiales bacterium]|nr:glycosyltransferase [Verrucomicrobiales bacterium]
MTTHTPATTLPRPTSQITRPAKVGYVVKRYPRFSETFIVNEILAHEAAGRLVDIFSLYPPNDTHFQDVISRVRSRVTYLPAEGLRAADLWSGLEQTGRDLPKFWVQLSDAHGATAREVFQAAWLARLVIKGGITHLHAHFGTAATTVARLAARFAGIPYSFTAHAKDIFHEEVDPADLRRKMSDASTVITVSDYNVAHLNREHGAAAQRVQRVYNGLHLDQFPFTSPQARPRRVVTVGRLIEKKGFSVLVDAVHVLRNEGVELTCEIIGSGELEPALRSQIQALGLDGHIELSGALPQGEVIRRVASAAVFAAPCVVGRDGNADGLPTVLLEAMALGTPCVGTDVTGIPELLRHGDTGWLVKQHDVEGLASALHRLLEDAELRVRLAARARTLLEAEFDVHRNAALLRALFDAGSAAMSSGPVPRPGSPTFVPERETAVVR